MAPAWRHSVVVAVALVVGVTSSPPIPAIDTAAGLSRPEQVGLFDPASGRWHLRLADGGVTSFYFGDPGDVPMMGDWDCDGIDTPGLYRRSNGVAYVRNSNSAGIADVWFTFGNPGDLPLAGDFDGDGCDTISVYRPSQGRVFVVNRLGDDGRGLGPAEFDYRFGDPGDVPFVGDFDGDGVDTIGLHRPGTGRVYLANVNATGPADLEFVFGDPADIMIGGDWTGSGRDSPAVFRAADRSFYLRHSNTLGVADEVVAFGSSDWVPVAGEFGLDRLGTAEELAVPITIHYEGAAQPPLPVTVGVPIPASISSLDELTVVGPHGPVPTQVREVSRIGQWRWVLVDFQADSIDGYVLRRGSAPAPDQAVTIARVGNGSLRVDTGAWSWVVPNTSDLLTAAAGPDGTELIRAAGWNGPTVPATIEVVDAGPVRVMVRVAAPEAVSGLDLVGRLHFYAGLPFARLRLTLTNHNRALTRAEAPGADNGECDVSQPDDGQPVGNGLLSPNRIEVEDVTWGVTPASGTAGSELIYQDSSGTDSWDYYVGRPPRMQSAVTRRGYVHMRDGVVVAVGDVAPGALAAGGVRLDVPWIRELFPKALRVEAGKLEFGVLPGEFADVHRLRAGEQMTADVLVGLDTSVVPTWGVYAAPALDWLRRTRALGYVGPRRPGDLADLDRYLDDQFDDTAFTRADCGGDLWEDGCATSVGDARRRWDFYGWVDYGDVPTDFENARSPYNLKYDLNLGFLLQGLRTGDVHWWELARAANLHFADIDIFHSPIRGPTAPRHWWEGGAFGHSYHNEEGLTNPHRNCANPGPDLYYGGAGLAAWALLTGDDVVRAAAVELADNTLWRIENSSDEPCVARAWGGGTGEGYAIVGPNLRGVANVVRLLVRAYQLTGETAYLDAAGKGATWTTCEAGRLTCGSWPAALLARGIGEYLTVTDDAGVTPDPSGIAALESLLELMAGNLGGDGARAWFRPCEPGGEDEINAWMLLAADAFAYGYAMTGERSWLVDYALPSFRTGQRDPYYEGDTSQYHSSKELANTVPNGLVFLHFADDLPP